MKKQNVRGYNTDELIILPITSHDTNSQWLLVISEYEKNIDGIFNINVDHKPLHITVTKRTYRDGSVYLNTFVTEPHEMVAHQVQSLFAAPIPTPNKPLVVSINVDVSKTPHKIIFQIKDVMAKTISYSGTGIRKLADGFGIDMLKEDQSVYLLPHTNIRFKQI